MKFLDLTREYEFFNWEKSLKPIFANATFINGPQVKLFEEKISEYIGTQYAVGVSSGTDAILVSIMAVLLDRQGPLNVLTTPYTFIATTEAPIRLGCKVIFCDVDKDFNINISKAKEILSSKKIDIFIPVHLFGTPCKLDTEILSICKKNNIMVIEDCAQAIGSSYKGQRVGSSGDFGCFSFFPAKNLGCAGDGGMITTNSKDLYEKCLMIRNHGGKIKYQHHSHGGNFRLDTIQAALLLAKLPYLDACILDRRTTASIYRSLLSNIKEVDYCPEEDSPDSFSSYNQFVIRVNSNIRDDVIRYLSDSDIPTAIYYPLCLSEQPCYRDVDFECDCKNSKLFAKSNIALPIAYINKNEMLLIIHTIRKFFRDRKK
jgi:dTDP-4-amino-4,6-dideoxygalactose transaminase